MKRYSYLAAQALLILGCLFAAHAASASSCTKNNVDVTVRNYSRQNDGRYLLSFNVSDSCPNDDVIESVSINFGYKFHRKDGSIGQKETAVSGYIKPQETHRTVISDGPLMFVDRDESIDDVYVTGWNVY